MRIVENEEYLHIQKVFRRKLSYEWEIGQTYHFGEQTNAYFQTFNTSAFGYLVTIGGTSTGYTSLDIYDHLQEVKQGKSQKKTELNEFYSDPDAKIAELLKESLIESLRYNREIILEEIRCRNFPDFPSRQRCIWLVPREEGSLTYWLKEISSEIRAVFRLRITGKLIRVNFQPLHLNLMWTLDFFKKVALNYWKGVEENSLDDEILFEGSVQVLEIVDYS